MWFKKKQPDKEFIRRVEFFRAEMKALQLKHRIFLKPIITKDGPELEYFEAEEQKENKK